MKTITVGHYAQILETTVVDDLDTRAAVNYARQRLENRGYTTSFEFEQRLTLTKAPAEIAYITWEDTTPNDLAKLRPITTPVN